MLFRRESHLSQLIGPIGLLLCVIYALWQIVKIVFHTLKLLFIGALWLGQLLTGKKKSEPKKMPLKQKMKQEREAKWHEYE